MSEPTSLGLNRAAIGRGWSDLLDNDIAIMEALLLLGVLKGTPQYDGLKYRINETKRYIASMPSSAVDSAILQGLTPAGPNTA